MPATSGYRLQGIQIETTENSAMTSLKIPDTGTDERFVVSAWGSSLDKHAVPGQEGQKEDLS